MNEQILNFYRHNVNGISDPRVNRLLFRIKCPDYPLLNAIILIVFAFMWKIMYDTWQIVPVLFLAFSFYSARVWIIKSEIFSKCIWWEKQIQKENDATWNDEDRLALISEVVNDQFNKYGRSQTYVVICFIFYIMACLLISIL